MAVSYTHLELLQKYQLAAKEAHESLTDEIKDKLAKVEAKSKSKDVYKRQESGFNDVVVGFDKGIEVAQRKNV